MIILKLLFVESKYFDISLSFQLSSIIKTKDKVNLLPFGTFATRIIRVRKNPNLVNYSFYHVSEDEGKRYLANYFTYHTLKNI